MRIAGYILAGLNLIGAVLNFLIFFGWFTTDHGYLNPVNLFAGVFALVMSAVVLSILLRDR